MFNLNQLGVGKAGLPPLLLVSRSAIYRPKSSRLRSSGWPLMIFGAAVLLGLVTQHESSGANDWTSLYRDQAGCRIDVERDRSLQTPIFAGSQL